MKDKAKTSEKKTNPSGKKSKGKIVLRVILGIAAAVVLLAVSSILYIMIVVKPGKNQSSSMTAEEQVAVLSDTSVSEDGRIEIDDDWITALFGGQYTNDDWTIGVRMLKIVITEDGGKTYGYVLFEDLDFNYDGVTVAAEGRTEAMKNAVPGDEFYYIEFGKAGGTLLSCKDYKYVGSKLK